MSASWLGIVKEAICKHPFFFFENLLLGKLYHTFLVPGCSRSAFPTIENNFCILLYMLFKVVRVIRSFLSRERMFWTDLRLVQILFFLIMFYCFNLPLVRSFCLIGQRLLKRQKAFIFRRRLSDYLVLCSPFPFIFLLLLNLISWFQICFLLHMNIDWWAEDL